MLIRRLGNRFVTVPDENFFAGQQTANAASLATTNAANAAFRATTNAANAAFRATTNAANAALVS
jgi:hypothetical protein